jgi:nuclear transport factor 2 (NTF2) superfamily protein
LRATVAFEYAMEARKLVGLVGVAAAFFAAASSSQASTNQVTLFEAPRELLSNDDVLRQQTLDEIQGLGVKWLRVVLRWRAVAPSPNASTAPVGFDGSGQAGYDWATYDRVVNEARARGFQLLVTISGPVPKWASGDHKSYTYKPNAARYQSFVTAVGNRYRDQVDLWSVWNEPNHPAFLTPQFAGRKGHRYAHSPKLYRSLFFAADRGLRASGNGGDRLLMGETAPRGTGKVVAPLRFLRGVLAPRGRFPADGYAHHAYTTAAGPSFVPHNPDDVTIGVLSRLTRALDAEARAHRIRRNMPIFLTEFGIQSRPDPFIGVPYQRQAEYRSIAEWYAWRDPRVAAFSQYLMRDDNPRKGSIYVRYSGFESGLRGSGGKAKLAYAAFRLPLVADARGKRVYLWGYVRPATGRTRVLVQVRKRGSKTFRNLKQVATNTSGYWRSATSLRRGAQYRVLWGRYSGPATRAY